MSRLLVLVLVAALSSCFSFEVRWERVETRNAVFHQDGYRLELPLGWARCGNCLTRDGSSLQAILFHRMPRAEAEAELDPGAPEFADGLKTWLGQDEHVRNLECEELTLAGRHATRARFEWSSAPGPPSFDDSLMAFFFPIDGWYRYELYWVDDPGGDAFVFAYGAPPLVYFERDLDVFERLVASLAVDAPSGESAAP
ncbi:MAG: hypothetical protein EXS08_15050 [Planctomycetes bacterium]|nr:hypothetical protein [Planctomycetota bacterium]